MMTREFSEEIKREEVALVRKGVGVQQAADQFGVQNQTLRQWVRDAGVSIPSTERVDAALYQTALDRIAALERDKSLTLRAIKELEFDRAMGKVSNADFEEMRDRLRARALRLMQQLEGGAGYRERIELDLSEYLASTAERSVPAERSVGRVPRSGPGEHHTHACRDCGALNESDARFCKMCGRALQA